MLIPSHFESLLPIMVPDLLAKESSQYKINVEAGSVSFQGVQTLRAFKMLRFLELQSPVGPLHPKQTFSPAVINEAYPG